MSSLRSAAILLIINGVGFGLPCVFAIRNLLAGRGIPMIMGFPAYGRGPFERIGLSTTVPLLAAFLLVCSLEVAAGAFLWRGQMAGAILALVLVPLGAVFWWGFALPFGPILALLSTVLLVLNWQHLN